MRHTTCVSVALCTALAATIGLSVRAAAQDPNDQKCISQGYITTDASYNHCVTLTGDGGTVACLGDSKTYEYYGGGLCTSYPDCGVNCASATPAQQTLWYTDGCHVVGEPGMLYCATITTGWVPSGNAPATPACHDSIPTYIGDQVAPAPPGWPS